ncbi:wiskott-Aldrich syndrome protein homolog isoform X2 [Prionailurus viverrinus]|uniref:wiskott-Aldrich syndrome protein homolog isoform X2 n=1 Tax=Prionailurus viverrinus TaxID=61388 RepID=UPI001FF3B5FA|nr:wiskott-Aldrich syndrome protein homolog isoform X2 [Prionailurus viverrinus]
MQAGLPPPSAGGGGEGARGRGGRGGGRWSRLPLRRSPQSRSWPPAETPQRPPADLTTPSPGTPALAGSRGYPLLPGSRRRSAGGGSEETQEDAAAAAAAGPGAPAGREASLTRETRPGQEERLELWRVKERRCAQRLPPPSPLPTTRLGSPASGDPGPPSATTLFSSGEKNPDGIEIKEKKKGGTASD